MHACIYESKDYEFIDNMFHKILKYNFNDEDIELIDWWLYERRSNPELKMYIDKNFGGTIVAPNSAVIIGQAQKVFYGTVLARDITVHQYATLFHVAFEQHLDNSFYAIDWRKK